MIVCPYFRFTTIWNYITLKRPPCFRPLVSGFTTIWNYITLKPRTYYWFIHHLFYHYLELHHSQTYVLTVLSVVLVLPLSGITSLSNASRLSNSYTKVLPLSGITSLSNEKAAIAEEKAVLPLSGITSLSNLKFQSQFAYLLKSSTSKTAITWQCNSDMVKIYSKI